MKVGKTKYNELLDNIGSTLQKARDNAIKAINTELVKANWEIGRRIVEFEQHGKDRAKYGDELLVTLSSDLKTRFGKGFSRSSLQLMRLFYIKYPTFRTVPGKLVNSPDSVWQICKKPDAVRHIIKLEPLCRITNCFRRPGKKFL